MNMIRSSIAAALACSLALPATLASATESLAPAMTGRMSTTLGALPSARLLAAAQVAPTSLASPAAPAVIATPIASPALRSAEARFDLSVNNAPAAQVFLQLGVNTAYNILVSPDLVGAITLSLKQTTVPEALETLRELYGYDFRMASGNRVFVYPNTVQTRLYKINYLPGRRVGASDLRVSSSSIGQSGPPGLAAAAGAVGAAGGVGGSTTTTTGGTSRGVDTSWSA